MQLHCPLVAIMIFLKKNFLLKPPDPLNQKLRSGVPLSQEALRESPLKHPNTLARHRYSQEKQDVIPVFKKLTVK